LFSGEDAATRLENLPGGEPLNATNQLDLESVNGPNVALQKYDGAVLLVTHDHDVWMKLPLASGILKLAKSRTLSPHA
jgi:hypothetical protein